ncbi:MAG: tetraacyldisaccharide 4'-kinase [Bdellovibrionales bacterium]|nr:tetraacyldisaccharide 4'-kinase [Bdellovibrionales bacterium]
MNQLLQLRKLLYSLGIVDPVRFPAPVVSVGNLSMGGTGKSPLVAGICGELSREGKHVLLLSRGYGRVSNEPVVVPRNGDLPSPSLTGDEPWMIRNRVPGISLLVHRNRAVAAESVWESLSGPQIVVMDDAFQHWKAFRDCDIVTIDATEGLDGMVLPVGRLREPPEALDRADAVVITRASEVSPVRLAELQEKVAALTRGPKPEVPWKSPKLRELPVPVLVANMELEGIADSTGRMHDLEELRRRPAVLFSGIARPGSFRRTVEEAGFRVVHHKILADHAWPEERDWTDLSRIRDLEPGCVLLTTEKDFARLHEEFRGFDFLHTLVGHRFRGQGWQELLRLLREVAG